MTAEEGPRYRAGRLLVASPSLVDPNFHRAVVLMLEHSDEGALGVVLNRPTPVAARDALPPELAAGIGDEQAVHEGGPVQPEAVIVLADFEDPADAASIAFDNVGIVDPETSFDSLAGQIRAARAYGGYAGWSGGQLEGEIEADAWIDATGEPADIFTDDPEGLWSRVLDRKGGSYRLVARMPDDPSLN